MDESLHTNTEGVEQSFQSELPESFQSDEHCCQQYADLSGLTVDEVKRLGSCGCVQAKAERDEARDLLQREVDAHGVTMAELERVQGARDAWCEDAKLNNARWHKVKAELERVTAERDAAEDRAGVLWDRYQDALQQAGDERDALAEAKATIEAYQPVVEVLKWIAERPPRPDDTYNHDRNALADHARRAVDALRAKENEDG